jgi:hypothetical protein
LLKILALPYYRIITQYTDGSSRKCKRQHLSYDLEFVNRYFLEQLKKDNKSLFVSELEAVMGSKNARDVREYIAVAQGAPPAKLSFKQEAGVVRVT